MVRTVREARVVFLAQLSLALFFLAFRIRVVAHSGLTGWEVTYLINWVSHATLAAVMLWRMRGNKASDVSPVLTLPVFVVVTILLANTGIGGLLFDGVDRWTVGAFALLVAFVVLMASARAARPAPQAE
jgi:hypothetical protein